MSFKFQVSKHYPPARYFFMPLYRKFRRKYGSAKRAMTRVMLVSWALHVALLGVLEWNKPISQSMGTIWSFFVFGGLTLFSYLTNDPYRKEDSQ